MINVTKTFLPPQEEYNAILTRAWNKGWITNRGDLVLELESKLSEYLKVDRALLMTNGTLPLQIAIKALGLSGEIITTPFSYVATTSSIVWENCGPVFVDIHPNFLTVDESLIEKAITHKTSAILVTHVYGNPCEVEAIASIANKHNLKVIYDAAHCFGVTYKGTSIFEYGDVSTCSFHATKLFHTGEGGALFSKDQELFDRMYYHHNFGHDGHLNYHGLGINAKISELQAAMGLAVFPYLPELIAGRKRVVDYYNENILLENQFKLRNGVKWNYSYYPLLFEDKSLCANVINALSEENIIPRKYFYPSLDTLPYTNPANCPIASSVSDRVICLPLYHDLPLEVCTNIVEIINNTFGK